jgi:hypothetical protein
LEGVDSRIYFPTDINIIVIVGSEDLADLAAIVLDLENRFLD